MDQGFNKDCPVTERGLGIINKGLFFHSATNEISTCSDAVGENFFMPFFITIIIVKLNIIL